MLDVTTRYWRIRSRLAVKVYQVHIPVRALLCAFRANAFRSVMRYARSQSVLLFVWYDMIWYMIYLLTATGLTPGGSSTVHIYTQTIQRTTQITTNVEECGPCPVFASFTLAFALQLRKNHGKSSVRERKTSRVEWCVKYYQLWRHWREADWMNWEGVQKDWVHVWGLRYTLQRSISRPSGLWHRLAW
jgi:hypothetical protein